MKTIVTFLLLFTVTVVVAEQQPIGSTTSYIVTTNGDQLVIHFHNNTSGSNWVEYARNPISLPCARKDSDSGIIYYIESDGRHVTAINPDGSVLWHRDPFADANMEFYRTDKPQIVGFSIAKRKPSEDWKYVEQVLGKKGVNKYIGIVFNSSQAGFMDITTGDFHMTGQL